MKIGFIGLGNMGMPMLQNLSLNHKGILAYDIVPELVRAAGDCGAEGVDRLDRFKECDVVISMLPAGKHVAGLFSGDSGLFNDLKKGSLVIDCSTIDVNTAKSLHQQAEDKGLEFLDAPVSGGIGGAQKGTLSFLAGGSKSAFTRAKPYLERMGKNIFHAGAAGMGQIAKICNNMLLSVLMNGTSEALALGAANGMDPSVLSEIMKASSGGNWTLNVYNPYPGVMPDVPSSNNYRGGFKTSLMIKDLNLAMENAENLGMSVPMGAMALQMYRMFSKNQKDDLDFSAVIKQYLRDPGEDT